MQLNLCKVLQTAHRHQTSELKSVMAALNDRDEQLTDVRRQLKDVSHSQATDKQTLIDMIAALKGMPLLSKPAIVGAMMPTRVELVLPHIHMAAQLCW